MEIVKLVVNKKEFIKNNEMDIKIDKNSPFYFIDEKVRRLKKNITKSVEANRGLL